MSDSESESTTKYYVKGFKLDRAKIAAGFGLKSRNDPEVDAYIPIIKNRLNRSGYKYVALVWEHEVDRTADGKLGMVFVLDGGYDAEELKRKELGEIDWSLTWARPVLVGPDVWESYD
jgi:hypothetical protein